MIPQATTLSHASESISPVFQQTVEASRINPPSVADLSGLGFVLFILILASQQLTINLYRSYQLHCLVVSLQRRATLERHLYRRSSVSASQKSLSQRT